MVNNYYVYALLDPRKSGEFKYDENIIFEYEPFYIGKGKGQRIDQHFHKSQIERDSNRCKVNKILKIKEQGYNPIKIKIYENLEEENSLNLEKYIISIIGKDKLTNLTDGGEKTVHWNDLSLEIQLKLRKLRSENMLGSKNPMKNEETSNKIRMSKKGEIHTQEYKNNMSEKIKNSEKHKKGTQSLDNRKKHQLLEKEKMRAVLLFAKNMIYINEFESIMETSRQIGVDYRQIWDVLNGNQKTAHGFKFKYKTIK